MHGQLDISLASHRVGLGLGDWYRDVGSTALFYILTSSLCDSFSSLRPSTLYTSGFRIVFLDTKCAVGSSGVCCV